MTCLLIYNSFSLPWMGYKVSKSNGCKCYEREVDCVRKLPVFHFSKYKSTKYDVRSHCTQCQNDWNCNLKLNVAQEDFIELELY